MCSCGAHTGDQFFVVDDGDHVTLLMLAARGYFSNDQSRVANRFAERDSSPRATLTPAKVEVCPMLAQFSIGSIALLARRMTGSSIGALR
jgi:hypothetical protein